MGKKIEYKCNDSRIDWAFSLPKKKSNKKDDLSFEEALDEEMTKLLNDNRMRKAIKILLEVKKIEKCTVLSQINLPVIFKSAKDQIEIDFRYYLPGCNAPVENTSLEACGDALDITYSYYVGEVTF